MQHYSKSTYIISGLIIFLLLIGIGIYNQLRYSEPTDRTLKPAPKPSIAPELRPFMPQVETIRKLMKSHSTKDKEAAEEKAAMLIPQLPEKYQRYYVFGLEAGLEDVEFHGRVVDQHGKPVVGARVNYSIGGALMAAGSGSGIAVTDEQGNFSIRGRGGNLTLNKVEHPEVDFEYIDQKYQTGDGRRKSMTLWGFQHTKGGDDPIWSDYTKDKPYIFKAWRVGEFEKVKKGHSSLFLLPDGRVYTIDFNRRHKGRTTEGEVDGHIRLSCTRGYMEHNRDWGDWTVTISAVNGGIQSTNDNYLNFAPDAGYQSEITITQTKGAPDYQHTLRNQRYYFAAKNGQVYGSLFINYEPYTWSNNQRYCVIRINQYKINANGSRNLAVRWRD